MAITTASSGLDGHGLEPEGRVFWNPSTSLLYTHALASGEASLAEGGPLVVDTGKHTGRSAKDKFFVQEPESEDRIAWGEINQPISEEHFDGLRDKVAERLNAGDLYVVNAYAGSDPAHRLCVRVITGSPWHALFAKTLFIDPDESELADFEPDAVVFHAPEVEADPDEDGTRSETFVVLHPSRAEVLIGGTEYAGEIKKSIFTVMNDRLPLEGVFPMHCSANVDDDGRVAIFFGLSGDAEPEIYKATHAFGTVLENVVTDERGILDLNDDSKTENTRAAYKLEQIANALPEKRAGHAESVVFLTADAFGVLPPIARLTRDQALFYFLTGFTAKLAGTEIGVTEPQPTFSCAFGGPFLPQQPTVYARMLGKKLDEHRSSVWLVNTGWTGGPYGEGERMPIAATRALLSAALDGELDDVEYREDPIFGFDVPVEVPGVDSKLLDPRSTWSDPAVYDEKATYLARRFKENFEKFGADENIVSAGPRV